MSDATQVQLHDDPLRNSLRRQYGDGIAGPPYPNDERPLLPTAYEKSEVLDHQLVNLRHVQHHAAQIMMRVRDAGGDPGGSIAADPMPNA